MECLTENAIKALAIMLFERLGSGPPFSKVGNFWQKIGANQEKF
jgi:hypothetical protein